VIGTQQLFKKNTQANIASM